MTVVYTHAVGWLMEEVVNKPIQRRRIIFARYPDGLTALAGRGACVVLLSSSLSSELPSPSNCVTKRNPPVQPRVARHFGEEPVASFLPRLNITGSLKLREKMKGNLRVSNLPARNEYLNVDKLDY